MSYHGFSLLYRIIGFFVLVIILGAAAASAETYPVNAEMTYLKLLRTDKTLQDYNSELTSVWKEFAQSFNPQSQQLALAWYKSARTAWMNSFPNPGGNHKAFSAHIQNDPILPYMQQVVDLAKKPDARLQYLLVYLLEQSGKTEPSMPDLNLMTFASGRSGNPGQTMPSASMENSGYLADWWQKAPGSSSMRVEWKLLPGEYFSETYEMFNGNDGALYGLTRSIIADKNKNAGTIGQFTRTQAGKISIMQVVPQPVENDFFATPMGRETPWQYPEPNRIGSKSLNPCAMYVTYEMKDDTHLEAILEQANSDASAPAWQCVAQCSITYKRQGEKFVPDSKNCKTASANWGVFPPRLDHLGFEAATR